MRVLQSFSARESSKGLNLSRHSSRSPAPSRLPSLLCTYNNSSSAVSSSCNTSGPRHPTECGPSSRRFIASPRLHRFPPLYFPKTRAPKIRSPPQCCSLSRATLARDANHNRVRRSTTPPSLFAAKNDDGAASSASEAGGEPRQRKKRPRKHVPVLEDSISGEPVVGTAEEVDLEPWMGLNAGKSTSTLPEPTFKERKSFERIMEDVLGVEKNEELPGILTKHVEFLLSVDVTRLTNDLIRCVVSAVAWRGAVWYCCCVCTLQRGRLRLSASYRLLFVL